MDNKNNPSDVKTNTATDNSGSGVSFKTSDSVVPGDANTTKKIKKRNSRKVKKIITRIIIFAVIIGVAAFFLKRMNDAKKNSQTKDSSVNTAAATVRDISSEISSSGTIAAKDTYSITALVSGTIISADFEEGDQVEKGQVLYQVDVSSLDSEMASAQNSLDRAQSSLSESQKKYSEAQNDYSGNTVKASQSGYVSKLYITDGQKVSGNANLVDLYNDTVMRIRVPFLSGEASLTAPGAEAILTLSDTLEQVPGTVVSIGAQEETLEGGRLVKYILIEVTNPGGLTGDTSARATIGEFTSAAEGKFEARTSTTMAADLPSGVDIEEVLVNVGDFVSVGTPIFRMTQDSAEDMLKSYKDSVDSAQSQVESAQQKLDSDKDSYENYTITAPISGQVITKTYKVGDKIGSSGNNSSTATSMATIYDMSEYRFDMSIDEQDITSVEVGQEVSVEADAFSTEKFTGKVTKISLESTVSNGVSTYPVTVTLDSTEKLLPGMNVDGYIILDSAKDAVCVPADALQRGNKVYVKDDSVTESDGTVPAGFKSVDVKTGIISTDYVQITEGIKEGDIVYVKSSQQNSSRQMMGGPMEGGQGGSPPNGGGDRNSGGGMPQ